jgi:4-diphosphocytidyl-2-C-methyl-D-erythritol kinase
MNELYSLKLSKEQLMEIGARVGSDVPFCITQGTCRCEGRGEKIKKLNPLKKTYFVIVNPGFSISTKWVYDNFNPSFITEEEQVEEDVNVLNFKLFNDLEKVVVPKYKEISGIKEKLRLLGCSQALMSGSGSSVFGIVQDELAADNICSEIKKKYVKSYVVESING